MGNKLFVAGIPYELKTEELTDHFEKVGTVTSANIVKDRETGRSRGFGFVEMGSDEEAEKAMKELDNTELGGRTIHVKEAKPREDNPRQGSGYGGGRNDRRSGGGRNW